MPAADAPAPAANLEYAEAVREGSRWIDGRPSGEDFAKWFKDSVQLHEGMEHDRYIGGIVLISGTEKRKVAQKAQSGQVLYVDETKLVHTPYPKVETRVAYFWDYVSKHPEWVGVIEPAPVPRMIEGTVYNANLPDGFFRYPASKENGRVVVYIGSAMRVRILRADTVKVVEEKTGSPRLGFSERTRIVGVPVAEYAPAVKMVASQKSNGDEDPFVLMKAETGAVGRALGMAGMLVIPGSSVATAEDMWEADAHEPSLGVEPSVAAAPTEAPAPAAATPVDQKAEIVAMLERLEGESPAKLEEVQEWAKGRNMTLSELTSTQVRAAHKKLSTAIAELDAAT